MKVKNVGGTVALIIFIVMLVGDLVSTLMLWDLIKYLEANPIYDSIGIVGIVLVNIVFSICIYFLYTKTKKNTYNRFVFINLLVTVSVLRIVVIVNNLQVWASKPTVLAAQSVTQAAKTEAIVQFGWIAFVPYTIALITFWLFKKDHNIEAKGAGE